MSDSLEQKTPNSAQVIIEKLAHKRISEKEAEESLQQYWGRAYNTPTLVRLLREVFRAQGSIRRVAR